MLHHILSSGLIIVVYCSFSYLFQVKELIKDCFVSGTWDPSEDAKTRLEQDGKYILFSPICYTI